MDREQFTSILALLKAIPDPRKARGKRYTWIHLLAIICAALLSGQQNASAIAEWAANHREEILHWLGTTLHRIPSGATLRRALRYVDIEALERLVGQFIQRLDRRQETAGSIRTADGQLLRGQALDGKELRGASAHGDRTGLVSLVRHDTAATLAQQALGAGASETEVARAVLASCDLSGTVTTMDALHTSRATAQQIIDQGGHYLLVVKENRAQLHADIEAFFQAQPLHMEDDRDTYHYGGKGHGRIETRTLTCSPGLSEYLDFPGVKQVARRRCQRIEPKSGKRSDEVTYAITSLDRHQVGARQLETLWRGHWTVENKSHYVRDETMREDRCQIHKGNAAQAMAALRNVLLATLRFRGWTSIAAALRHYGTSPRSAFVFIAAEGL